jgi:type I restriction enzyme S subunit
MSEQRWDVPGSWTWTAAGDIARIVGGGTPSSKVESNFTEDGIPWITPADLTGYQDSHISRGRRDLSESGLAGSGAQLIPAGSVLFSSRAPIGYCVVARNEVSTSQGFKNLVLDGKIVPEYLRYYLLSAKEYAESKASGTTFMELSGTRVAELAIPLAPLAEQRRVVEKVDGLTDRTARARKELERIPPLIDRYKSAVLSLAFSGNLTKDWRTSRGIASGDAELPVSWIVKSLEDIGDIRGGIQVGKKRPVSATLVEVPYLRVANVQRGWLNLEEIKTLHVTPEERDRLLLNDGDILMNEGGDRDKLGRGWIWRNELPVCIHQNHVFRVRLIDREFPSEFVSYYANEN